MRFNLAGRPLNQASPLGYERKRKRLRDDVHHNRHAGFTLIEVMIAVVIVAILAAVALPSYQQYTKRNHRAGAKVALLMDAQFMERIFTESNAYNKNAAGASITSTSLPYQKSPIDGTEVVYNITITVDATSCNTIMGTPICYILTATPATGGPMVGDACGALTLNNQGIKGVGGSTVTECWGK